MKEDIKDDQIMVLGQKPDNKNNVSPNSGNKRPKWLFAIIAALIVIGLVAWFVSRKNNTPQPVIEETVFEPIEIEEEHTDTIVVPAVMEEPIDEKAYVEISDTVVNDITLRMYAPVNARLTLHVGDIDIADSTIVYCAQAADIRRDNGRIVGGYVLKGEPLAWGRAKKGFCAIINDSITVGMAENTSLFEKATEKGGYFFRQFPLVSDGQMVENQSRGKSKRRSLCEYQDRIVVIESLSRESFHDFSEALADFGVKNAIYLVGSTAYSYAVLENGKAVVSGDEYSNPPEFINFIVWRKK